MQGYTVHEAKPCERDGRERGGDKLCIISKWVHYLMHASVKKNVESMDGLCCRLLPVNLPGILV